MHQRKVAMKIPSSAESLWRATTRHDVERASARGGASYDVVIVGAGITGLTTAYHLVRAGASVAVLEARTVGSGVTGFTTAHLTEVLDVRYKTLARDFGEEGARAVRESSRAAISSIEHIAAEEGIACDFRRLPGYLFSESLDLEELTAELEAARHAGADVLMTSAVPLGFARHALRFDSQAQFHPLEYLFALARVLDHHGVVIHENARVSSVESDGALHHALETSHGVIHAKHVVFATHSPLTKMALQLELVHRQSYVLAFALGNVIPEGLFWDTADPYHYLRCQRVGDADVLIVGGEDHKTGHETDTERCYEKLFAYAHERFGVESVHLKWSSQVVETVDGLPYIGPLSEGDTVQYATGYAGNGMTLGTLAASIMSDNILGRPNDYAKLYAPSRIKPLASAAAFVVNNADVSVHFVQRGVKHLSAPAADTVLPGQGNVVKEGGQLIALYRDDQGARHAVSAVCPHLGCVVKFNQAERTWDCPCHGSRFDVEGAVICGPASTPLAPRKS